MEFTTPCIIRKNTTKIRNRLKELGYNCNPYLGWHNLYTSVLGFATVYSMSDDDINVLSKKIDSFIDCGTNEELFLAIAALRDDTSANQYWVFDQDFPPHYQKGDFTIGHFHRCSCYCHNATVEELIEHFKGKEINHE